MKTMSELHPASDHHHHDYHYHHDQDGHQVNLLRAEANSEVDQPPTTPRINSSACEEEFFDRVELFYISFYKHVFTRIHLSGGVAIPANLEST